MCPAKEAAAALARVFLAMRRCCREEVQLEKAAMSSKDVLSQTHAQLNKRAEAWLLKLRLIHSSDSSNTLKRYHSLHWFIQCSHLMIHLLTIISLCKKILQNISDIQSDVILSADVLFLNILLCWYLKTRHQRPWLSSFSGCPRVNYQQN